MICPSCNTGNRDDAKFCKGCGRSLAHAPVAPAIENPPDAAQEQSAVESVAETSATGASTWAEQDDDEMLDATLVISPEKMMAYHQRRHKDKDAIEPQETPAEAEADQQEQDEEHHAGQGFPLPTSESMEGYEGNANIASQHNSAPTMIAEAEQHATIAPALSLPTRDEHGAIPIPPPPPPESLASGSGEGEASMEETPGEEMQHNGYDANAGYPEMEMSNTMQDSFEHESFEHEFVEPTGQSESAHENKQEDTAQANEHVGDEANTDGTDTPFAALEVGTVLQGRYEISAVMADNEQEHIYSVIDHEGYQRCWNCSSENNTESDDFCTDCGASLRDIPYIMHEYSAEQSKEDTPVLQGNIVNTFVAEGRTYVIEQKEVEQNAFPNGVHLLAASGSDAGNVRRSDPNEDSALVLQLQRIHESLAEPVGVYIVADGMGGHDNGQLASRMTINVIAEKMTRELLLAPLAGEKAGEAAKEFDEDSMVALLHDSIEEANAALCEVNTRNKTDMGSTLTGFMIVGQHAFIVNVGDSRTYMVRSGQIYQLTTDHSLVGQLVASGLIEPDDVYTHPQRSQIYRSLGDKPNTQIDIFKQQLHPGDKLLSCCDGLWEMIRNPQIESVLNTTPDPQTACQQLIDLANENGGEDNITAVIVYVQ
ncbi:MAG: protein phosphatase 2C domain-containing protein [Ktedonobacteraceae bacterium]